jgi:hypothetical protein
MPRVEAQAPEARESIRDHTGRDAIVGLATLGLFAVCAILAVVVIMPRVFGSAASPSGHNVQLTLTLSDTSADPGIKSTISGCHGTGGYSDLTAGGSVILRDEKATILGSTFLPDGTGTSHHCTFTVTIPGVTDSAAFYVIEVTHRGQISKSHADMASDSWAFSLSIGS